MEACRILIVLGVVGCQNEFALPDKHGIVKTQSLPIQDEPEGRVSFQYKMSLGRMAC